MKTFTIRELETRCNVKAHTIRVWEKRYGVFQPQRTSANARRYTIDDLAKLLGLVLLTKSGYKISSLAQLPPAGIQTHLRNLVQNDERILRAVHELIICMYTMNVAEFESVLDTAFLSWPIDTVIRQIIYPFLEKAELLCQGRRLNEEHFVVTAVRKKLYWSIQRTLPDEKKDKTVLLFLSGERQLDLLLLYVYYLLEAAGWTVIHLGMDVSVKNLDDFLRVQKVDYLLTYLPKRPSFSLPDLAAKMDVLAPAARIVVIKGENCFSVQSTANVVSLEADNVLAFLSASQRSETPARQALALAPAF